MAKKTEESKPKRATINTRKPKVDKKAVKDSDEKPKKKVAAKKTADKPKKSVSKVKKGQTPVKSGKTETKSQTGKAKKPRKKTPTKPKCEFDMAEVERLAGQGLSTTQIALCLGISTSTYFNNKRSNKEFGDAIARGKAFGVKDMSNALFQSGLEGNVQAQKFWLQVQDKWQDRVPDAPVSISIGKDITVKLGDIFNSVDGDEEEE